MVAKADLEQSFTGERFLPDVIAGPIRFEHLHRYAVAGLFARGRVVLDIACGDGYGAALMNQQAGAAKVIGVDIDEPTIARAKLRYAAYPALSFVVGSTDSIPLDDASVDCVVSFETIEHHDRHRAMIHEFERVLKPQGILILSSPNRPVYSEGRGYSNPFHVKELDGVELVGVLRESFPAIRLWGQKLRGASFIYPVAMEGEFVGTPTHKLGTFSSTGDSEWEVTGGTALEAPMYFLAVCARQESSLDKPAMNEIATIFADASDDLIQAEISRIAAEMSVGYEAALKSCEAELARTQSDFQGVRQEADNLIEEMAALRKEYERTSQLLNDWEVGPYGKLRRTVRQIRGGRTP